MQKKIKIFTSIFLIIIIKSSLTLLFSQNVDKLRNERELLLKEIERTQKLISSNINSREEALKQVNLLNHEIKMRRDLIDNFKTEIEALDAQIAESQSNINNLELNIKEIKDEYIRLIQSAYLKRNTTNELLFLFSAKDFTEAYNRHRNLKEYSNYRKKQGEKLIENQKKLKVLLSEIQEQKYEKEQTLNKFEFEKKELSYTQNIKLSTISELQKEEKFLKQTLKENEKKEKELNNKILEYIKQSKSQKSEYGKDFKDNKGKLIWPVTKGIVVNEFGEHEHPVMKGVLIKNNGIDIQSTENNDIVAVHEGEISRVISIPGYNNAIIIRHGDFLTVYANLKDVLVKQGQKVERNQKIGKIYVEKSEKYGILHFEIWNENQKLDPLKWLKL